LSRHLHPFILPLSPLPQLEHTLILLFHLAAPPTTQIYTLSLHDALPILQKMKSPDLKRIQYHNQRERESRTNDEIDTERSHKNYDLVNNENINYNERVKEIIESQKIGTRKTRKDAVLVNELMITSDKNFFD